MLVKGYIVSKENPYVLVPFKFNPKEFTVEKSNQFAEVNIPGLSSSVLQFVRGNNRTISLELFFDTYEEKKDVRQYTDIITGWDAGSTLSKLEKSKRGLMDIDSELHAPPICLFVWGSFVFQCVITQVSKKFTMFLPEGIPVRATLSVTLKEYKDINAQLKDINAHSSDITKRWTVKEGDSIWFIADKEYGDPSYWKLIAKANGIKNPRYLIPGQQLLIPPKE